MTAHGPDTVFDRAALLERTRGDPQVMQRVLASFVVEAGASLRALRAASERGNLRFAQEFAYTLRLAAANVGAYAIARAAGDVASVAARIDATPSEAGSSSLASLLALLEADLGRFHADVARELGPAS